MYVFNSTVAASTAPPPASEGSMVLNLVIEQPEIVMVEDALTVDTKALIMDVSLTDNLFDIAYSVSYLLMKDQNLSLNIVGFVLKKKTSIFL